jgi:hypothetical protein
MALAKQFDIYGVKNRQKIMVSDRFCLVNSFYNFVIFYIFIF